MVKQFLVIIVLLFFAGLTYSQKAPAPAKITYGSNPAAGHYIRIRGFTMYYETYGKGEPLLIMHGNGGSIHDFTNQIPYFEKHYQVIVADSRAQGKSVDRGDSLSYEMMAEDFAVLLDSLHIRSSYVIGWSDGGNNGLLLAIHHPDKVKKLAITGANLWVDTSAISADLLSFTTNLDSLSRLPQTPELKNEIKLIKLLYTEPNISLQQLHAITCPTLVIGGDHDVILPKHTMLIAQSIPKSYLWILPNSGHSTPVVYKEQFNKTVADFFNKPYRIIQGMDRFY